MSKRAAIKAAGRLYVASGVLLGLMTLAAGVGIAFGAYVLTEATDQTGRTAGLLITGGTAMAWLFLLVFCYAMMTLAEHVIASHERADESN